MEADVFLYYRQISQIMYQPKILILKLSPFVSSQMYLFMQGLSYRPLSIPGKNSIPKRPPFSN